jgi:hypothetical protein
MRAKRNSERRRSYGYIQASGLTSPRPTEARGVPIALGAVDQGTHVETQYAHHHNARRLTVAATERASEAVRNLRDWAGAVDELRGWPEYAESPLRSLDHTARRLSVGKLYYKDESERFGRELASFKALGAPYAVFSLLADTVENQTGRRPIASQLRGDEFRAITEGVTVCVATDGNQGRGLAYAAKAFGCRCVIYIHGHVSPGRKDAVERFGAVVIRIDGEYEASVARAKDDAEINDWHFVSSTSWDEFRSPVPRSVMQGYMVLVEEALAQLPDAGRITHVFMQGGVGSIAAAVFLGFHQRLGTRDAPAHLGGAGRSGLPVSKRRRRPTRAIGRKPEDDHGRSRLPRGVASCMARPGVAHQRLPDDPRHVGRRGDARPSRRKRRHTSRVRGIGRRWHGCDAQSSR